LSYNPQIPSHIQPARTKEVLQVITSLMDAWPQSHQVQSAAAQAVIYLGETNSTFFQSDDTFRLCMSLVAAMANHFDQSALSAWVLRALMHVLSAEKLDSTDGFSLFQPKPMPFDLILHSVLCAMKLHKVDMDVQRHGCGILSKLMRSSTLYKLFAMLGGLNVLQGILETGVPKVRCVGFLLLLPFQVFVFVILT
jgi:hypothetical protein